MKGDRSSNLSNTCYALKKETFENLFETVGLQLLAYNLWLSINRVHSSSIICISTKVGIQGLGLSNTFSLTKATDALWIFKSFQRLGVKRLEKIYSDALIFRQMQVIVRKNLDWERFYTSKYPKCIFGNNFSVEKCFKWSF